MSVVGHLWTPPNPIGGASLSEDPLAVLWVADLVGWVRFGIENWLENWRWFGLPKEPSGLFGIGMDPVELGWIQWSWGWLQWKWDGCSGNGMGGSGTTSPTPPALTSILSSIRTPTPHPTLTTNPPHPTQPQPSPYLPDRRPASFEHFADFSRLQFQCHVLVFHVFRGQLG